MRELLLLSGSVHKTSPFGPQYLEWAGAEIGKFMEGTKTAVFIPFAKPSGKPHDEYTAMTREALAGLESIGWNGKLIGLHEETIPGRRPSLLQSADVVITGGGNTHLLLRAMYAAGVSVGGNGFDMNDTKWLQEPPNDQTWYDKPNLDLLGVIREEVLAGRTKYFGSSAGTVLACPTIRTTNDMPIVHTPSYVALNLFPTQINPHFLDHDPNSTHAGEPRETRLLELYQNTLYRLPIVGLREGSGLLVNGDDATLFGSTKARVYEFEKMTDAEPATELEPPAVIHLRPAA